MTFLFKSLSNIVHHLSVLVDVVAGRSPVAVEQIRDRVACRGPFFGAFVLVVSPGVDKSLELDHVHELLVSALSGLVAISVKAQCPAIVNRFHPEAILVRALFRRVKLKHDIGGKGNDFKLSILCVEEQEQL